MALIPTVADLEDGFVVVFDTNCLLCSRWVHFLLAHERDTTLIFISAWSVTGQAIAARHGLSREDLHRTYLVIRGGRARTRSGASIALLRHLRAPWCWFAALAFVPRPVRDGAYDWVARNRYAWIGRRDDCFIPPPAARSRFIQDEVREP